MKEIGVDVDEIWSEMLGFRVSIGLLPLVLIISSKWKPVKKVWKKSEVDIDKIWRKMLGFGVSIGLLPLVLIIL